MNRRIRKSFRIKLKSKQLTIKLNFNNIILNTNSNV